MLAAPPFITLFNSGLQPPPLIDKMDTLIWVILFSALVFLLTCLVVNNLARKDAGLHVKALTILAWTFTFSAYALYPVDIYLVRTSVTPDPPPL